MAVFVMLFFKWNDWGDFLMDKYRTETYTHAPLIENTRIISIKKKCNNSHMIEV